MHSHTRIEIYECLCRVRLRVIGREPIIGAVWFDTPTHRCYELWSKGEYWFLTAVGVIASFV